MENGSASGDVETTTTPSRLVDDSMAAVVDAPVTDDTSAGCVDSTSSVTATKLPSPADDGFTADIGVSRDGDTSRDDENQQVEESVSKVNDETELVNGDGEVSAESADNGGFHLDTHQETEETSRTEEVVERADGGEEFRLQESKKLVLEEAASKETERAATDEEIAALEQQLLSDGQPGATGGDGVEILIEKDIHIDDFKRVESIHEDKVAGEPAKSVETVTEEQSSEDIKETPLKVDVPSNGLEGASENVEETNAVANAEPAAATELPANDEAPVAAAAAESDADLPVTAESQDEAASKEKGSKSKGLIGFLKARARSQSRERDERGTKDENKPKKDAAPDDTKNEPKKSGTLEREKKFKLNLFSKKGDEETVEGAGEDGKQGADGEKEAGKHKSLKKTLFGKKNKDKSVDDNAVEKAEADKEKAGDEHGEEADTKTKKKKVPTATLR